MCITALRVAALGSSVRFRNCELVEQKHLSVLPIALGLGLRDGGICKSQRQSPVESFCSPSLSMFWAQLNQVVWVCVVWVCVVWVCVVWVCVVWVCVVWVCSQNRHKRPFLKWFNL
jgi:hypothetical protein